MTFMMIIQLLVVLVALWIGARYGSLALGAISGIGLAILVFGFQLKPSSPPTDVIYIIIAAVTCAGVLQASGGMDWMIQVAEKLLRKHPDRITLLAPFCTFFLTILVGTGHVVYTLMPIICDIALKKGIRPERPCGIASIASQIGITCSPIAAAVVAFSTISSANGFNVSNIQVIMVTIPACIIGILCAVAYSYHRGLDLDKDPKFQARLKDPVQYAYIYGNTATTLDKVISKESKRAVYIFLAALAVIVIISVASMFGVNLLPSYDTVQVVKGGPESITMPNGVTETAKQLATAGVVVAGVTETVSKPLAMNVVIQITMITAAALMIIFCKAKPKLAISGAVWQSGMVAVVAIYGIAWMANTYFDNYKPEMQAMLSDLVSAYPWTIAIAFFLVSVLINSQGAVVVSMLPLAYSLHIEGWVLLGVLPSVYGYFFIPNYPSDIATVNFDRSGTTVIGKYLLNHSFMIPGLIHVFTATIAGYCISFLFHSMGLY
jgi:anaerobic C4-dicarboxylate transporter DcuB